nr:disease resistance protein RPV1-like [Ziziphus jujuba var. spinosa]
MEVLQISFDGLEDEDMNIFLLIACFFRGSGHKDFLTSIRKKIGFPKISIGNLSDNDKDYVTSILKKCSFNPIIGIRNLGDKSLLSIKDNKIWVHDLLEEMGWKILEKKSLTEKLGRQIKLWNVSNVSYVLKNCTAIEEIEAVVCFDLSKKCPTKETFLNFLDVLTKMKKLKLLKLDSYSLYGLSSVLPILQSLSNELDNQSDLPMLQYLSNELLILQWVWCPFQYFPLSFQPTQLVEVDMSYSRICRLWGTVEHLPKLRSVRLFGCINLTEIFNDFTLVPNLEVLDLGHCRKLSKIDPSIQFLGKLIHLDLRGCISLENLPPSLRGMVSLKILYLGGCYTLRDLPKDIVYLKSLELLNIQDTAITHVPIAILKNLRELFFDRSSRFHEWHHPGSFAALDYKRLSRWRSI